MHKQHSAHLRMPNRSRFLSYRAYEGKQFRLRGTDSTKADEQNRDTSPLSAKRRSAHRDTRQRHDAPAAWSYQL